MLDGFYQTLNTHVTGIIAHLPRDLPQGLAYLGGGLVGDVACEPLKTTPNYTRALIRFAAGSAMGAYLYSNTGNENDLKTYTNMFVIAALARSTYGIVKHLPKIIHIQLGLEVPASQENGKVVNYVIPLTDDLKERIAKHIALLQIQT